ncbi:MAG: hypothetical protein JWM31_272 [Solirubrobacterales bacterium]|nr:hypothetical protein [Solirubrobacterales bacterium]
MSEQRTISQSRRPAATERRAVRSEDPSLSAEANDLLTQEAQAVIGATEVEVPAGTPHRSTDRHGGHSKTLSNLGSMRQVLIVMACAGAVVCGIIGLQSNEYLAFLGTFVLLVVALVVVVSGAVQLTTELEHVDPSTAARLEQEGVPDPDRVLSDLVEDFAGAQEARGAPEVVSAGHNQAGGRAAEEPVRSSVEQRSAQTPTSAGSRPAGGGSAIAALPWYVTIGMMVASLLGAIIVGGRFWAVPAIVLVLGAGWIAAQRWMIREGEGAGSHRGTGDETSGVRRLGPAAIGAGVLAAVILIVLGFVGGLL